jgi:hypothetical protein
MNEDKKLFKEWVKANLEALDEDMQAKIKANGYTIDKIVANFTRRTIDWYYLADNPLEDSDLEEIELKEYGNELTGFKHEQYLSLEEAFKTLSDEEKKIYYKINEPLSYFADVYDFDDPKSIDEAREVLEREIQGYLEVHRPYYSFSEEQIKNILTSEGLNPNTSLALGIYLDKTTKDINNYQIDKTKPLTYEDLDKIIKEENGLNYKYLLFCEEYIKTGNITKTCEYVGIGRATAYRWLALDEVQEYLSKRKEEIQKDTDDTFKNTYNECFSVLNHIIKDGYKEQQLKAVDIFLKHYTNIERLKNPTISED